MNDNAAFVILMVALLIFGLVGVNLSISIGPSSENGIPTSSDQPSYVVTEAYSTTKERDGDDTSHVFVGRGITADQCVFVLESTVKSDGEYNPFYESVKLYRNCDYFKVGDTIYFAPLKVNYN
jgi:hypothetical protein